MICGSGGKRQASVPEISHHANDGDVGGVRDVGARGNLQKWRRSDVSLAARGIFGGKIAALEFLADQRDGRSGDAIRFSEVSAMNQRNSQCSQEMGIDDAKLCAVGISWIRVTERPGMPSI